MIYLIVQEWSNTKNNHAGMYHLAKLLSKNFPETYKLISIPDFKLNKVGIAPLLYNAFVPSFLFCISYFFIAIRLLLRIKNTDIVILFEYLTPGIRQDYILNVLKFFKFENIRIYGFVHLVPSILKSCYSDLKLNSRLKDLTGVFTFGSSLQIFLEIFTKKPIYTFLHYSDLEVYKPLNDISQKRKLNILIIGQQARNYSSLDKLICSVKYADFRIVVSDIKLAKNLQKFSNVNIYRNIAEEDLLKIMEICNCCLGFYDDIVGSNVLSNCISMGIIPIVKDVGSVRDYLSDNEAFICDNESQYKVVLDEINQNYVQLNRMREALLEKSQMLSWENFHFKLEKIIKS
jgi:glycosyltransferase involved in cell wall biosynthesis